MKSRQRAASTRTVTARTIMARLASNLRTYGSRMREKLKGVYSLKPMSAMIGSREY